MNANQRILHPEHWDKVDYRQRMTTKEWRKLLLDGGDTIIFKGTCRKLKAVKIFPGVYEVSKCPATD